jgi:hypothetical protein
MIELEIISSICKVVMFLTACYLFIIGFKFRDKKNIIFSFWYLSIFSLFDSLLYIYFIIITKEVNTYISISKWLQLAYILFEFYIISSFLFEINKIKHAKTLRRIIIIISATTLLVSFINNWDFKYKYYSFITIIELVFINTFAIRYLLIISPDDPDQNNKSVYILVKGLFLFINISSPYYLIIQLVISEANSIISLLSFINDIAYTVFFVYIIKSLKCQYKKLE